MAYVGGPSRYLSGQKIFLPLGTCCDEHTAVKAVARIVGESDSLGFEAIDMCQECYTNFQDKDKVLEGVCDWCGSSDKDLAHKRDPEEGASGRVYLVCVACIAQKDKENAEENKSNDEDQVDDIPDFEDSDFDLDQSDRTD